MPIELAFVNAVAQGLVVAALMLVICAVRQQIGSRGIIVGFELLLLTIMLRLINELAPLFGLGQFAQTDMAVLTWIAIVVLFVSFVAMWKRRFYIRRIETSFIEQERKLEQMRRESERGMSWDHQYPLAAQTRSAEVGPILMVKMKK